MEEATNHLGNSSHSLGGRVFDPIKFTREPQWQPLPVREGAVPAMQIHYRESRGYPGTEVEDESACSEPVALDLSGTRSWKLQVRMLSSQAYNV